MRITPGPIRAARRLAGLTQPDLVTATGLSLATIKRAESDRDVPISEEAIRAIRTALEEAGVGFLAAGKDGGVGVQLRR
jgi:transcriptional regulator with XRE-family HTH domain